jgi:hypothetical protein
MSPPAVGQAPAVRQTLLRSHLLQACWLGLANINNMKPNTGWGNQGKER